MVFGYGHGVWVIFAQTPHWQLRQNTTWCLDTFFACCGVWAQAAPAVVFGKPQAVVLGHCRPSHGVWAWHCGPSHGVWALTCPWYLGARSGVWALSCALERQ